MKVLMKSTRFSFARITRVDGNGMKTKDVNTNRYGDRKSDQTTKEYKKKSAMVLRTYDGLDWTPSTIQHIRSYIMELSLHSGGEYEVIILSEVKDQSKKIFDYEEAYRTALIHAAPPEFRTWQYRHGILKERSARMKGLQCWIAPMMINLGRFGGG